ncbi:MAG: hypothetical protein ACFFB3_06335 [Candidatus Hodarchaeota archaeon]
MEKIVNVEQRPPFAETYLVTAGFPLPKSFDSSADYLKAIENWVREATSVLIEANDRKRDLRQSGY